jgi:GNAT superfamily N-acetyltransferase
LPDRQSPDVAPEVELLVARDDVVVEALARLINRAYALGESGLWLDGALRITPSEVAASMRDGNMLVARLEDRIVGCAYVRPLDAATADLGLVSAEPEQRGRGLGRQLVGAAEELGRSRGVATMQLELLVPTAGTHPEKERLRAWYTRLGYRIVRSARFEEFAAQSASRLAVPCEFLVFEKPLAPDAR